MKKSLFLIVSLVLCIISCKNEDDSKSNVQEFKFPDIDFIVGLASPITLNTDSTVVSIEDYVPENVEIENIQTHDALQHTFSGDSLRLTLKIVSDDLPKLSYLNINLAGISYSILLKKSEKIKYKVIFDPKGRNYQTVQLKGEMNAWNPTNTVLTKLNGMWETEIEAEPGIYQYLFVVNGKEILDPGNSEKISNGMGGFNSVIRIGHIEQEQKPVLISKDFAADHIEIAFENNVTELLVQYKNYELDENFISLENNIFSIYIPADAKDIERTHIRIWAYNEYGLSNDLFIPLLYGEVISDPTKLKRTDFHSAVLYNAFVDRFYDGNPENNRPTKNNSIHPRANYHGGDIEGITKKIEDGYFKQLGINTIWISPIVKNPEGAYGLYPQPITTFSAYHGYWPISFTLIDDRFGTEDEFKTLVKTAHDHDMNVILDFVANHVHQDHPVYKSHKEWATNLYLPDGTLNTEKWDEHRLTTWFDIFLPTLDLSKPEVYEMLSDSAVYWIDKYELDGFRHDATKHIPEVFWQTLTKKLKNRIVIPEERQLYQIGETYGTPELIGSYVNSGQLDAQFDFNVYDALINAIANNSSFENLSQVIQTSQKYYGSHHLMGNITGNQDKGRFISYASGSLKFEEDAKYAGWTRDIGIIDSVGYKKCALLNAIVATIPGLPVIFYGDEIGMPGGNDPDNRRMMRFDNLNDKESKLKDLTSRLINIRRSSLALIYGDLNIIKAEQDIFIYERSYFGKFVYVIINNSHEDKIFDLNINQHCKDSNFSTKFGSDITVNNKIINIKIQANSFDLIMN